MALFLLHQLRNGEVIGVFNEDGDDRYLADYAPQFENYGREVVGSKGKAVEWDDWVDQLASKSPSPNGGTWDAYNHTDVDLDTVLNDARKDTDFNG